MEVRPINKDLTHGCINTLNPSITDGRFGMNSNIHSFKVRLNLQLIVTGQQDTSQIIFLTGYNANIEE
jgi:hypothetical protein